MWKYIIIGSLVLFLAATFVFYKNHGAMTAPGGEVAAVQTQLQDAINKNKNISLDKTIKAYSEMRTEWINARKTKADAEKSEFDGQTETLNEEIAQLTARYEALEGESKRLREELDNVLQGLATAVGLEEDTADPEEVARKVAELMEGNIELERKVAVEEAAIAALGKESEKLNAQIAAARKLNQDRQARISPAELECHVINSDPTWDYVILDAGIDKGIVIGSRLAVMRDGKQICELNVTLVEASRTSCDVVYSTLLPGERVHSGDRVISVRNNK